MNKKLNLDIDDADPASSITLSKPPEKKQLDSLLEDLETYFKDCSYDCGKNYSDGFNVELIRESLDVSTLLSSVVRIVFDYIRQDKNLDDNRKIELSLIYQSIDKLLQILKTDENKVAHNDVLCKLIGYCMKNYQTYK